MFLTFVTRAKAICRWVFSNADPEVQYRQESRRENKCHVAGASPTPHLAWFPLWKLNNKCNQLVNMKQVCNKFLSNWNNQIPSNNQFFSIFNLSRDEHDDETVWSDVKYLILCDYFVPANWSSDNAFVSGAGGQRFKFRASRIGHSVAKRAPPPQHFFERSCVAPGVMTRRWAPQTRYTLPHNTASIMKNYIWCD